MMIDSRWLGLARQDDQFEVRELVGLASRPEFSEFFKLSYETVSPDGSAVVGRCGYLFVNDGSNKWREQLHGTEIIDDEARARTAAVLNETRKRLRDTGISFQFVVIPEKDVVYPEFSPNAAKAAASARSIHKIADVINGAVVYPLTDLLALTRDINTFHARNSHVNFYGGLQLAETVLVSLGRARLDYDQISSTTIWWPDDLSIKWVENLHTRRRILSRFYQEKEVVQSSGHVGRHLALTNAKARSQDKIIVFGDSYSWNPDAGLARFLALEFAQVDFVWKKQIDWELVTDIEPSVVLLQSAERFLITGLPQ
jgi:hypothetical protein